MYLCVYFKRDMCCTQTHTAYVMKHLPMSAVLPLAFAASSFLCWLFFPQIYNFEWRFFWNTLYINL